MNFTFVHDEEAGHFCEEIVQWMMENVGVSLEEAFGRVDRYFNEVAEHSKRNFVGDRLWYHEPPEHWANFIYYGGCWWQIKDPQPTPYP